MARKYASGTIGDLGRIMGGITDSRCCSPQTLIKSDSHIGGKAAVDFYFIQDDGGSFKATVPFEPYFFVGCRAGSETQVEEWLVKKYEGLVVRTERRKKWDLSLVSRMSEIITPLTAYHPALNLTTAKPLALGTASLRQDLFPQYPRPTDGPERSPSPRHCQQRQAQCNRCVC